MAESERLYEEVKFYFLQHADWEFVIRMSSAAKEDWELIPFYSEEEAGRYTFELGQTECGYAKFSYRDGSYRFKFVDKNLVKEQILKTGEITCFIDRNANEFNMRQVIRELHQLMEELQGS